MDSLFGKYKQPQGIDRRFDKYTDPRVAELHKELKELNEKLENIDNEDQSYDSLLQEKKRIESLIKNPIGLDEES